ncbi:MAG: hypothetical protein K6E20_07425 [Acholeplasmatales bacterium]|nr:hypothetical protein [Acholeplasmatales bacterium]
MFNQQKYINDYIKNNYKTIKLRIRKDDKLLINKINSVNHVNQYLIGLIKKDIYDNRKENYINNEIVIDFKLSNTMQDLVDKAEEADILEDYGLYMNLADAIDTRAKNEVSRYLITEREWRILVRRYES